MKRTEEGDSKLREIFGFCFLESFEELVNRIERSEPSTENHYGDYLTFLEGAPIMSKEFWANALIYLGANRKGAEHALKLLEEIETEKSDREISWNF